MNRETWSFLAPFGVVVAAGVMLASCGPSPAERAEEARRLLDAEGLSEVEVRYEGREALLSGEVEDAADLEAAKAATAQVKGTRDVDTSAVKVLPKLPATVRVRLDSATGELTLSGTVHSAEYAAELEETAGMAPGVNGVKNELETSRRTLPPPRAEELLSFVPGFVAQTRDAVLTLDGQGLHLEGEVESPEVKRFILGAADELQEGSLAMAEALKIVAPPAPATLTLKRMGREMISLEGTVATVADKETLGALVREAAPAIKLTNRIKVKDGTLPGWWQAPAKDLLPELLKRTAGDLEIRYTATTAETEGTAVDAKALQELTRKIETTPPAGFDILTALEVAMPMQLSARRAGRKWEISGLVPDRDLRIAMIRAAQPGDAGLEPPDANLDVNDTIAPQPWMAELPKLIQLMDAAVADSAFEVMPDELVVTGTARDEAGRLALAEALQPFSSGGLKVRNEVTVKAPPAEPAPTVAMADPASTPAAAPASPSASAPDGKEAVKDLPQPGSPRPQDLAMSSEPESEPDAPPEKRMTDAPPAPKSPAKEPGKDKPADKPANKSKPETKPAEKPKPKPVPAKGPSRSPSLPGVYFPTNSSYFSREELDKVRAAADAVMADPNGRITVTGYADYRGDDDYNLWLSERRAHRVREQLQALGVPAEKITVAVMGEEKFNQDADRLWESRRVDFEVSGGE